MSNFEETFGKTIEESFKEYDEQNPHIYQMFKAEVLKAIGKGKKKLSSKAIINYLRWEIFLRVDSEDEFKINDAYTSRYARKFIDEYPGFESIFDIRKLRSS